jgi:hypothetical protein
MIDDKEIERLARGFASETYEEFAGQYRLKERVISREELRALFAKYPKELTHETIR